MKYKKLTGIILKKQNYREADQIVTSWTKELGKVRFLAKAVRRPASKLNHCLIDLSEVELELTGSHLPTLIGAKTIRQFRSLHEDLKKAAVGFYVAELMLKMTADEHPNILVYELLADFLQQVNEQDVFDKHALVDRFALDLAQHLGFGSPKKSDTHRDVNKFIEYILERNLKSEPFLISI